MVENGHIPELNQVSSTSGSCVQPSPGGCSSGPTQRISPAGPYQTGMRCPHHSCREMHQSCMLSTQSKYLGANSCGWIRVWPPRTASPAACASGPTLTNHWVDNRGSMTSSEREQCPTEGRYGTFSATTRPCDRS